MNNSSKDRLIKNEQLIRDRNKHAGKSIKKYFRGDKVITDTPVAFICECSNLDCKKNVSLSILEYEAIHKRADYFVIYKRHVTKAIEKVVQSNPDYDVVEKFSVAA